MKNSFFSRFLGFTLAFYAGTILSVFILTVVKTAAFFPHGFWPWLGDKRNRTSFLLSLPNLFVRP
jgi:hypothetical protein